MPLSDTLLDTIMDELRDLRGPVPEDLLVNFPIITTPPRLPTDIDIRTQDADVTGTADNDDVFIRPPEFINFGQTSKVSVGFNLDRDQGINPGVDFSRSIQVTDSFRG